MQKIIIAIDGVSGCGKSTTAREIARILGYLHFDSGAMYRAVTVYFMQQHIALADTAEVARALADIDITFRIDPQRGTTEIYLNRNNVEREIREIAVSEQVSHVSALQKVRSALVEIQRKLGEKKGIVMDGRDIGTTVFPQAELKIFMLANLKTRSLRRQNELWEKTHNLVPLEEITVNLTNRDQHDTLRNISPLRKADDAIMLNTTHFTINEQVDEVVRLAMTRIVDSTSI